MIFLQLSMFLSLTRYGMYFYRDFADKEGVATFIRDGLWASVYLFMFIYNFFYFKVNRFPERIENTEEGPDQIANIEGAPYEISNADEADESLSQKKPSKLKAIWGSIVLVYMFIFVTLTAFGILNNVRSIISSLVYKYFTFNMLQQEYVDRGINTVSYLIQLFFALWVASAFNRSQIVTYGEQGLDRNGKPFKSFLKGCLAALAVIVASTAVLMLMDCSLSVNKLYPRIIYTMVCAAIIYLGVAFAEEIISRGIILGYCEKNNMKIWGVIISSIFFVGLHFVTGTYSKLPQAAFLIGMSLLFSALKMRRNNLYVAIGCHYLYDWMCNHLVELTALNNKASFFSVMKLTIKKQGISIGLATVTMAVIIFAIMIIEAGKKKKTV